MSVLSHSRAQSPAFDELDAEERMSRDELDIYGLSGIMERELRASASSRRTVHRSGKISFGPR